MPYRLKPGIKEDPARRWNLPDRIFFGHGACHILAGVFLNSPYGREYSATWIKPKPALKGHHIICTRDEIAFDYHGYSNRHKLVLHHCRTWAADQPDWSYRLVEVDFDLLDTAELNARGMRGPDQYLHDPIARAEAFVAGKHR